VMVVGPRRATATGCVQTATVPTGISRGGHPATGAVAPNHLARTEAAVVTGSCPIRSVFETFQVKLNYSFILINAFIALLALTFGKP
jgi:hypothetical protein